MAIHFSQRSVATDKLVPLLSPDEVERSSLLEPIVPDLFGLEAAWSGAMLAEAMNLSGRSFESLSLNALLATEAFAVGRTAGVYGAKAAARSASERFEKARRKARPVAETRDPAGAVVREVLLSLLPDPPTTPSGNVRVLRDICEQLVRDFPADSERFLGPAELGELIDRVELLRPLVDLEQMPAEERVRYLRHLQTKVPPTSSPEWPLFAFGAGYVVSRIGSAERDLRLADTFSDGRSAVLSWAIVAGSLGATAFWTDAFAGLGRLAARELVRPLHMLDPPNCDIGFEEFEILDDRTMRSKLRTATRTTVAVAILPGVTVQLGVSEVDRTTVRASEGQREVPGAGSLLDLSPEQLDALADRLTPYLKGRLSNSKGAGKARRSSSSLRLPFREGGG